MSRIRVRMPAALAAGLSVAVLLSAQVPSGPGQAQPAENGSNGAPMQEPKSGKRSGGGTLVQVDRVKTVPMAQTLPLVGRLVAIRTGVVASRIDAPVAEMRVDVGDAVRKGDVIAILANDRLKWDREQKAAELAAAQAAVATAKARLALAEQELKRFQDLQTSAAFSKARFEDKRLEVARLRTEIVEAQAKVEQARAALKLAETELSHTRILAPYDGTIIRRQTEAGAFAKEGEAVYAMVSNQDLEVEADVPATRVGAIPPGTSVTFELGGGKKFEAVVRAVVPVEDLRTRTRTVRLTPKFGTRPDLLAANQSATVHIPLGGGRSVLSVHKDGVIMLRGTATAFVVADGRAQTRAVRVGESVGDRFEILSGLKEGEIVVTRGNERLRDGERVRYNGVATQ